MWWFGTLSVFVAGVALAYAIDPAAVSRWVADDAAEEFPLRWTVAAFTLPPTLVLTMKRLADRSYPTWFCATAVVLAAALSILPDPGAGDGFGLVGWGFLVLTMWIVVDCGFLPGRSRTAAMRAETRRVPS